jgi:hypothetical protein
MPEIPRFKLTHGQVAWAICQGQKPDDQTLDALRYLRQLGVPFTEEERGVGRGNRLYYTFDHLIECAVAIFAIRRGVKPQMAASFLTGDRAVLRKLYRSEFRVCTDAALTADWVKSRGTIRPIMAGEQFIRLHEGFAERGGKIEMMTFDEIASYSASLGDLVERYPNRLYPLVPLRRVMLEVVAWALEAPVTPPGRPPRRDTLTVQVANPD